MGRVADRLRDRLQQGFSPERLDIVDDSSKHAGHAGAREGGESHFTVTIVSPAFEGLSRVERQRRVYAALSEELAGPVHALSLKALTPGEA
jgi:BolA protein